MSGSPTASAVNRDASDAAYMESLIFRNEELLLEVEKLRAIIHEKGLDRLQSLREENEELRQQLRLSESHLQEKEHQLEVLESAYSRFDGVHSALLELAEQRKAASDMLEQFETIKQQNSALKTELLKLNRAEEEARGAQEEAEQRCHKLDGEVAEFRTALDAAIAARDAALTDREAADASSANAQARAKEWQERHAAVTEQLSALQQEADKRSRLRTEKQGEVTEDLRRMQDELLVARRALTEKDNEQALVLAEQQDMHEKQGRVLQNEIMDLRQAVKERETHLQQYRTKVEETQKQVDALKAEKEMLVRRYEANPNDVAELQKRLKELQEETSKKDMLQLRFATMLASSTSTNSDVKELFEAMLDYQERRDEELQTKLLIQQIQAEDMQKVYKINIRKLRAENESLMAEILFLREAHAAAVAPGRGRGGGRLNQAAHHDAPAATTTAGAVGEDDGTPRRHEVYQDIESPSPAQPKEVRHPHNITDSGSSLLDDLWRVSSPRPAAAQPTARYHDPHAPVREETRASDVVCCPRCTLLNQSNATACDACGHSLRHPC
ncbi:hypothetical protein DQ04_04861000 [Trypanosoma grayi]|uniref:hypothetical protein n=1 Tax=Trypanosoma grayi TaxID=71804 RepID=UPI0004F4784A|nr:hypothetical protein DQ04_04861000 [Trypanosoma grayi]KEG09652.1 hypothetical protein DQ04_04861000 [Trypanosoma grayi]